MVSVESLKAREILDSRGFPTVEAEIVLRTEDGRFFSGRAAVPSGASTGEGEALELRDGDAKRFAGKGVLKAVENIRGAIASATTQRPFVSQKQWDELLLALDGTPTKQKLGANAILGASMAFSRAFAASQDLSLSESLARDFGEGPACTLPVPLMNILNGGKHADNGLAIQEFMIVPLGFTSFKESLRAGVEVFHALKKILSASHLSTAVGDEGGFAPVLTGAEPHTQALGLLVQAIERTGYKPGKEIALALDCAASEFSERQGADTIYRFEDRRLTALEMGAVYQRWMEQFPIVSIEDGLAEHDWDGWSRLTRQFGARCQWVGDDLFVTNPLYLQKGIDERAGNAILIKLNQIGTVTETLQTMKMAKKAGYRAVVSHRSGETEDTFIADLAVATNCGQIKTGSASRSDRTAKYNQLLRLEEALGSRAVYPGRI